jgi:hypothetical protein
MERKVEWTEAVLLEMREIFEFYENVMVHPNTVNLFFDR